MISRQSMLTSNIHSVFLKKTNSFAHQSSVFTESLSLWVRWSMKIKVHSSIAISRRSHRTPSVTTARSLNWIANWRSTATSVATASWSFKSIETRYFINFYKISNIIDSSVSIFLTCLLLQRVRWYVGATTASTGSVMTSLPTSSSYALHWHGALLRPASRIAANTRFVDVVNFLKK